MDNALLSQGIEAFRALLMVDGGDLELLEVDRESGVVAMRLILEGAHCRECVMPREFLEPIALDLLATSEPAVTAVSIDDPRE